MLYSSDICLKCSPPTDHVSQAGKAFVRGLPAVTICNWKDFFFLYFIVFICEFTRFCVVNVHWKWVLF